MSLDGASSNQWFDGHLDLAYMAAMGRRMELEPGEAGGPDLPAAVTLPSLRAGGVQSCLGTIFVEPGSAVTGVGYTSGDAESAHAAGVFQLEVYRRWAADGVMNLAGMGSREKLGTRLLMEGADPIRQPDELAWWVERGVRAVGMAWVHASGYAGGNQTNLGLTEAGRELAGVMDSLGVVHDVSHLSDRSFDELMARATGRVMASHSNCRALIDDGRPEVGGVPAFQRHLRDEQIREIASRDGMIGINLFSPFLIRGGIRDRRATLQEFVDHVEHVCQIVGDRQHVALGSDMDGGFSAKMLPDGINSPADLSQLTASLGSQGWTKEDIENFRWGNWSRFWRLAKC